MKSKLLAGAALLAVSTFSFAQEVTPDDFNVAVSTKSRADVRAELAMWQRAGLDRYNADGADRSSTDYQRRTAMFNRLMSGPEYIAEVQRIEGRATRTANAGDRTSSTN